jgi:hypothetical protein
MPLPAQPSLRFIQSREAGLAAAPAARGSNTGARHGIARERRKDEAKSRVKPSKFEVRASGITLAVADPTS